MSRTILGRNRWHISQCNSQVRRAFFLISRLSVFFFRRSVKLVSVHKIVLSCNFSNSNFGFSDEASLVYVATSGICSNPGKVVDSNGRSLLHLAASVGKRSVAEWLLRFKEASINSKDQASFYRISRAYVFYRQD
jgi:Ankyrin repeat